MFDDITPMKTSEMARIVGLPRVADIPEDIVKKFSERVLLPTATWKSLNQSQVAAMLAYIRFGGLLGAIGVGWGKTSISFKIADLAYTKGLRKIILLVPANCVEKTVHELPELKLEISLNFPIHVLGGKTGPARAKLSKETSGLFVMSYSQLSLKDTDNVLSAIGPQLIIADEAHNLANIKTSSAAKRIKRYMDEFPRTEFAAMSGTLTSKGLHDYAHLSHWSLKDRAPIPTNWSEVDEWNQALGSTFSQHVFQRCFAPLIKWARANYPTEEFNSSEVACLRKAFKYRLETAPGSITSGDAGVKASLLIENVPVTNYEESKGFDVLETYMHQVNEYMMAPDGTEIQYAIHKFRYLHQLSAGIYLELYWPTNDTIMTRRQCNFNYSKELLDRSHEHHKAHQMYSSELRGWLEDNSISGLDTPMLLGGNMSHHSARDVGSDLFNKWKYMKSCHFEEIVVRDSRSHRVCSYKIDAAVKMAKKLKKSCIFWVYHAEMGLWLYQEMKKAGLPALHCPSGKKGNGYMLDKSNKDMFMIASVCAHGTGKNLQHFKNSYSVQFPRSATQTEQCLGRLHRQGYKWDQCVQYTNNTLDWDHQMMAATISDSLYIHQTQSAQKLIYADYEPVPEKFSAQVLKERGFVGNIDEWDEI